MFESTRRRMATALHRAFAVLVESPDGLETKAIMQHLRNESVADGVTHWDTSTRWRDFNFGVIGARNAGWLRADGERWTATETGRAAYREHRDALSFFDASGAKTLKGWVATRMPVPLMVASRTRYQIAIEYRLIRRVGVAQLARELLGQQTSWREALPVQRPRVHRIAGLDARTSADLEAHFEQCGVEYGGGGHTLYLSPSAWARTAFAPIQGFYPQDSGLKISRNPGRLAETEYVNTAKDGISHLHKMITHGHRHLTLVSNLFHVHGIGPRLDDLIELETGQEWWVANVVGHIDGRMPTDDETRAGLAAIKALEQEGVLKVSMPDGYNDEDFRIPDCNGNALVDRNGWKYVDHQNFLLLDYDTYLKRIASESQAFSHYGDRSVLRGKNYLYQAVPGVPLPGKRDPARRMDQMSRLLERCGVTVADKLVLDVGCNVGMMMAQYLRSGASWCHGWDLDTVTPNSEKLLRAVGCTRFSLTGGNVVSNPRPEDDIPAFLHPQLQGCVVSYLAVHKWIGWLPFLGRIPWSFMIFEGHEFDTEAFNRASFAQFGELAKFEVAAYELASDGDSEPRAISILVRK